jgi:cysteine-rich repeat protein
MLAVGAMAGACGDNLKPVGIDARAIDAPPPAVCGNGTVEAGEDCDDGDQTADAVCDAACHFTCGNGVVDDGLGELCDPGIGSGDGACPTTCDDGMACTSDVLAGSGCQASCSHGAITAPVTGDGCCPPGASSLVDGDCPVVCGNGVLEAGEACDTGIAAGAGACPTVATCDDGMTCTSDRLEMPGTCAAACAHAPITTPMNNDGCCPPGATPALDNDCGPVTCGNGIVDPGETCDIAILVGPGRCPATCDDGMACTSNVLLRGGTCTAACSFPPITTPVSGDGCCPAGANHNNDSDCPPVCGNGVVEAPEQCDDGNQDDTDACTNACMTRIVPTAFRLTDLDLRDPHVFVNFLGCRDVTDTPLVGFSVNGELQTAITTDGADADNLLDLSLVTLFRPLIQFPSNSTTLELHFASCTAPQASTSCAPGAGPPTAVASTTFTAGMCLAPVAGSVHIGTPYSPAITSTTVPCYVSGTFTITLSLAGIPVTLRDARIAATWVGNPATSTVNGLFMGFLSEADANATIIPATLPLIGGQRLSSLLPGGTGSCAPFSDKDTHNGVMGWWFYFNFPSRAVPWTGP